MIRFPIVLQNGNEVVIDGIKVKSDDILIKNQIKSIGEHKIQINPYEDINEELNVIVNKN